MSKPLTETLDRNDSYGKFLGSDPIKGYGTAEPPSPEYSYTVKEHLHKELAKLDLEILNLQDRREDLLIFLSLLPNMLSDKQEYALRRLLKLRIL